MPSVSQREMTIRLMIATAFIMLLLAVGALASLGGDETQTAIGKVMMAIPIFALLFYLLYMAWKAKLFYLWYDLTSLIDGASPIRTFTRARGGADEVQYLRQELRAAHQMFDESQRHVKTLEKAWLDLFGTTDKKLVREAVQSLQKELERLRLEEDKDQHSPEQVAALEERLTEERSTIQTLRSELVEKEREVTEIQALLGLSHESSLPQAVANLVNEMEQAKANNTTRQHDAERQATQLLELTEERNHWQAKAEAEQEKREEWRQRAEALSAMVEEAEAQEASWNAMWEIVAITIRQAASEKSVTMNQLARIARSSKARVGKQPLRDGSFKLFTFTVREGLSSPKVLALINEQPANLGASG